MAFNLEGIESGAGAGAATGNPWLIAAGALLGGLFGPRERYTPAQRQQQRIANEMEQFAGSVPLSDPQEQSALAEQRGLLGEAQRQNLGTLMGMSPNYATTGAGGAADQVRSMRAAQTGQSMALSSQALMNALMARRRALMEAAQVAQGVGRPQVQPGLGPDLANLMRAYSAYKSQQGGQQPYGGGYSGPTGYNTGGQAVGYGGAPATAGPGSTPDVSAMGTPPGILGNGGANFLTGGAGQITPQAPQGARFGMPTSNSNFNSDVFKTPPNPFFNPQRPSNPWDQMMNMANRPQGGMGANVFSDLFNQQAAGGNPNLYAQLLQGVGGR